MNASELTGLLAPLGPVSHQLAEFLTRQVRQRTFRKGDELVSSGGIVDKTWMMIHGLAKSRYYDQAGRQVITRFWKENEVLISKDRDLPDGNLYAREDIVLLEESTLVWISNQQLRIAFEQFPETHQLARRVYFQEIRSRDLRQRLLIMEAAKAYQTFCMVFPSTRIQIQDVAYYLNVRPYTLSRIRGRQN